MTADQNSYRVKREGGVRVVEELMKRTYLTALAGLLHDIGKFGQRAGETGAGGKKDHPAVGDKFVNQHVPTKWHGSLAPVAWHHGDPESKRLPELVPVRIVALADRLSAGEREKLEEDPARPQQMLSVFSRLKLKEDEQPELPPAYLPLKPLELSESALFPKEEAGSPAENERHYRTLWEGFCKEADTIAAEDMDLIAYLESVFHLLRRYTWAIPSAYYYAQPDVSLYEHLHTTAALSACFARQWTDESAHQVDALLEGIRNKDVGEWPDQPKIAGLLSGDISGIQNFIYGIHHPKKATAVLRARSFYIQMLGEAVARFILRRLDLPITNALYVGGGTFTLIVPPLSDDEIAKLSQEINGILLRAYGSDLYLALGHVPMAPRDFGRGRLSKIWNVQLPRIMEERKAHRFAKLPAVDLHRLFSPGGEGSEGVCSICGREAPEGVLKGEQEEGEEIRWCPSCTAFQELGNKLRRARYLRISEVAPVALAGEGIPTWLDTLGGLGGEFDVGPEPPPIPSGAVHSVLFGLGDDVRLDPSSHSAIGQRFLVNIVPEGEDGAIKDFGTLARG